MIPILAHEPIAVGSHRPENLINLIENNFELEVMKLDRISAFAPDLGAAALERLERERDACRARLEEVFADFRVAEAAYNKAQAAADDLLLQICAYRCTSLEELAIKVRYLADLADLGCKPEPENINEFFASFLPEREEIAAFV